MTSAMMLIVCTLLFLASKSDGANGDGPNGDGANGDAKNDASDCQDNKNTGLLADDNCMLICNGTMSVKQSPAADGTKCLIAVKDGTEDKTPQDKREPYGNCQNHTCATVGQNSNVSIPIADKSLNSINQVVSVAKPTTTPKGNQSDVTTKVTVTGVSSAMTTLPTTVAPSSTGTPDANNNTPAGNNTTPAPNNTTTAANTTIPAANGSSRSRLVSAAGSQVLGVVLAIGALLLRAP
ncbi:uncharacterized protein LOC119446775 isoform X2 [Dermacentor silvarum]|nr:uncharacterized protein LOC119446775 isoform X2 [Dermacentor silvarum]XP_049520336.1 uncharacterized protein LOC119446775 isoform X2 [Dermacentor silvarum]